MIHLLERQKKSRTRLLQSYQAHKSCKLWALEFECENRWAFARSQVSHARSVFFCCFFSVLFFYLLYPASYSIAHSFRVLINIHVHIYIMAHNNNDNDTWTRGREREREQAKKTVLDKFARVVNWWEALATNYYNIHAHRYYDYGIYFFYERVTERYRVNGCKKIYNRKGQTITSYKSMFSYCDSRYTCRKWVFTEKERKWKTKGKSERQT